MGHKIYLIAARHSDSLFDQKRSVHSHIESELGLAFILPEYDQSAPSFSLARMRSELTRADLTIADLSLERPSCYYELGFAESLSIPVSVIAEKGTCIHQTSLRNELRYYAGIEDYKNCLLNVISGFFSDEN